jgi:hypothetical protein
MLLKLIIPPLSALTLPSKNLYASVSVLICGANGKERVLNGKVRIEI